MQVHLSCCWYDSKVLSFSSVTVKFSVSHYNLLLLFFPGRSVERKKAVNCWGVIFCIMHHYNLHHGENTKNSVSTVIDNHLYGAIFHSLEQTHCARMWFYMSDWLYSMFFCCCFLNIHQSGVLTALAWLMPHETAAVSVQVLCTPYNHAPCHIMQSHILKVYACLAVACYLHFWQNDRIFYVLLQ